MGSLVVWKGVKPAKLKQDAFRLAALNRMRRIATQIKEDFAEATKTWEHQPKFEQQVSLAGNGPALLVGTDDEQFRYVDEGTRSHVIVPRKPGGVLVFPGTFRAKTVPGVIGSGPGYKGGDIQFRRMVHHPGTEARRFTETIQKKWLPRFKEEMEDVVKEAARDSGHGAK